MRLTEGFILSEFRKAGISFKPLGKNIWIKCPFHHDSDPSLSVSRGLNGIPAGIFHCFGCGESGNWNKLADALNLTKVGASYDTDFKPVRLNKVKIETEDSSSRFLSYLEFSGIPKGFKWRGFSYSFLRKFDPKLCWDINQKDYFLLFPLFSSSLEETGYIRCSLNPNTKAKKYFLITKQKSLFPFQYAFSSYKKRVVLVEGIRDAFRLIQLKIPALAIIGTSITDYMIEQLTILGIERVVLLFDGDEAGRKAIAGSTLPLSKEDEIEGNFSLLSSKGFDTRFLPLPNGKDPFNVSKHFLILVKELLKK